MTEINVIVTGPEEAYNDEAEFRRANELMGVTVLHEERLHLHIDPRADGSPWLAPVVSGLIGSPLAATLVQPRS
jgi:hypothetical protein